MKAYIADMDMILITGLVITMGLVLLSLVGGLVTMARGKQDGGRRSNLFMRYRVIFQGCAILVAVILMMLLKD